MGGGLAEAIDQGLLTSIFRGDSPQLLVLFLHAVGRMASAEMRRACFSASLFYTFLCVSAFCGQARPAGARVV